MNTRRTLRPGKKPGDPVAQCPKKQRGKLIIAVKDDQGNPLPRLQVKVEGAQNLERTSALLVRSGDRAIAHFGLVDPGAYQVYVDGKRGSTEITVNVAPQNAHDRRNPQATITLPRVDPTIAIEAPKVVVMKRSYQDQAPHDATIHRISVDLGVTASFDGTGQLTCNHGDQIDLYDAPQGGNVQQLPLDLTAADLNAGHTLYIQGAAPSGSADGTKLTLSLDGGSKINGDPVDDRLTVVKLQIDVLKGWVPGSTAKVTIPENEKVTVGRGVHLQDAEFFQERAKLVLHQARPRDWTGNVVLTAVTGAVALFAEKKAANGQAPIPAPLTIANANIPRNGKECWVEGAAISGAMLDSGYHLGIDTAAGKEGDRVTMSTIKTELRQYKSRTAPAAVGDPPEFSRADKLADGRYIHVQDNDKNHGRARILVAKVQPGDFDGHLLLSCFKATHAPYEAHEKTSRQRVTVWTDEVAAAGQAQHQFTDEITHDGTFPAAGKEYWAEGAMPSGALKDAEVRLGVKHVSQSVDRAVFTTVKFSKLKADIPSTPANTVRPRRSLVTRAGVGRSNSPVKRHKFKVAAAGQFDLGFQDAENAPLVLIEGSVDGNDQVKLSVEVEPKGVDVPVLWAAVRDNRTNPQGDSAAVIALSGGDDPGLVQDPNDPLKATMTANAVGSLHISPYVDGGNANNQLDFYDANGDRVDREPYIAMNLVLVRAECENNMSGANAAAVRVRAGQTHLSDGILTRNIDWGPGLGVLATPTAFSSGDFNGTGNDAMTMQAIVRVVGGGADGKRGLNRVFAGWANNELDCPTSPGPHGEDVTQEFTRPGRPVKRTRSFWQQNLREIAGPMLDSGYAGQGTGGNTCTGTAGGNQIMGHNGGHGILRQDHGSGTGEAWRIWNVDSPGGGIEHFHPRDGRAFVSKFKFNINFQSELVFWTNHDQTDGPTDAPACRLYASVQHHTWDIQLEIDINPNTLVVNVVNAKQVNFNGDANRSARPLLGSGVETRQPDGLDHLRTNVPY